MNRTGGVIQVNPTKINYSCMVLILFISGAASVQFGRQPGPSVLAYHHYNAFAFLNQREDFDVLAAGTRTFLSPLIDLPFYFCTTMLPARACGFAAGFVQGLNYVGAVVVAALLLAEPETKRPLSMRLPWILVTAGALGATSLVLDLPRGRTRWDLVPAFGRLDT